MFPWLNLSHKRNGQRLGVARLLAAPKKNGAGHKPGTAVCHGRCGRQVVSL